MSKAESRKRIGDRIYGVRCQYMNEKGRMMTQAEFVELLNNTPPHDNRIELITYGSWERGDRMCPADKFDKIINLDKFGIGGNHD